MSKKFFYVLFYVFVFCKLLPTVFADRQYYGMDAIVKADTSSGMGGSVIDVKEIDRRVNAFASIVGEEDFVLKVGGTLLARSAFYGQQRDVASDVLAPRMSVESTDPREHIEVGSVRHEIVPEEHSRKDNSFTIPIGDLFTVMSRLSPREQLAKAVFEKEKAAGKTDAEALQTSTESKKIAEVAEKADKKVAIDATVEYTSEFADDPLGHSKDLALGTAYFAGDLITPGGLMLLQGFFAEKHL